MQYYDPNNNSPRRLAIIAATTYVVLLAVSFAVVDFDFQRVEILPNESITIDLVEPSEPPKPPKRTVTEPRRHETPDVVEQTQRVTGAEEKTQTANPKALFKMAKGGHEEPGNAGNPQAAQADEDKASGKDGGLSPDGFDQLDRGLQGRGLVGNLPRPNFPGNQSGKVLVRVTVNAKGYVTAATFEPKGSTISGGALVDAAIEAARKARFTENAAPVQGGTITYVFKLD